MKPVIEKNSLNYGLATKQMINPIFNIIFGEPQVFSLLFYTKGSL